MSQLTRRFVQDPFSIAQDLLGWDAFQRATRPAGWAPAFEVKETKEAFIVRADLPGVAEADLEVSLHHNVLTVAATRNEEQTKEGELFSVYERQFGSVTRRFSLPENADPEKIEAKLNQGVLTLTVAKKQAAQPRKIALNKG
ncbi:MAG TPA: Hsp20/alpha crystallin family protein [Kofleriaceae bacterium]|nr:Hsp20/alpha crystallin family protein [Kofleriaceae bacterium]